MSKEKPMEVKKTPITRHFTSGAVRGEDTGRGKCSLLPFEAVSMVSRCFGGPAFFPMLGLIEVSKVYEAGAQKYEDRNWERGIPFSAYIDSAHRHYSKFITGHTDEPHCGQYAWNLLCLLQTYLWVGDGKVPMEIADIPAVKVDVKRLRSSPLPIVNGCGCGSHRLSRYACLSVGSMWGFCYGKEPINLVTAVANALLLLNGYVGLRDGIEVEAENDLEFVQTE